MIFDRSDISWERIASEHPYYGVLSQRQYRGKSLDAETSRRFFQSGRKYLDDLLPAITERFGELPRGTALDFGCGTGRVVVPLAALFEKVIGVDVAPAMLAEAEKNCRAAGIENVTFQRDGGDLAGIPSTLAFVHSCLVFQHIPQGRGEAIFGSLIARLGPGGIAAIQLYVGKQGGTAAAYRGLRNRFFPVQILANLWRRRSWNEPVMQMNVYDANTLLAHAASAKVSDVHFRLSAGGSVTILLRKP
jgi:SAM-dependent methyltransferase